MMSLKMKIAFILIGAICLIHLSNAASTYRQKRDTPDKIDEMLDDAKSKMDEFFSKKTFEDISESVSKTLGEWGKTIEDASKSFANSVAKKTNEIYEKVANNDN